MAGLSSGLCRESDVAIGAVRSGIDIREVRSAFCWEFVEGTKAGGKERIEGVVAWLKPDAGAFPFTAAIVDEKKQDHQECEAKATPEAHRAENLALATDFVYAVEASADSLHAQVQSFLRDMAGTTATKVDVAFLTIEATIPEDFVLIDLKVRVRAVSQTCSELTISHPSRRDVVRFRAVKSRLEDLVLGTGIQVSGGPLRSGRGAELLEPSPEDFLDEEFDEPDWPSVILPLLDQAKSTMLWKREEAALHLAWMAKDQRSCRSELAAALAADKQALGALLHEPLASAESRSAAASMLQLLTVCDG